MLTVYALYAVGAVAALRFLVLLCKALTDPLRDIPGPPLARWTRLWYLHCCWKGQLHKEGPALHRKYAKPGEFYAPIVRLAPNTYSISTADKALYHVSSKLPKSKAYIPLAHPDPERLTIGVDRNIGRHAEERRKVQSMYSLSNMFHYEPYVDATEVEFHQRLLEMSQDGRTVDMLHWFQCFAFDIIGNITYSRPFGFLDKGDDKGVFAAVAAAQRYAQLVGIWPSLHPFFYSVMEKMPSSGASSRNYLIDFAQRIVTTMQAERAKDGPEASMDAEGRPLPRDVVSLLMDAEQDPERKPRVTKRDVLSTAFVNVFAGADTTGITLSSIIWHLTAYPRCMQRLRAELQQAVEQDLMTPEHISFKEAQKLPYLQACIQEGFRHGSIFGLPYWREVPKGMGGVEVMGRFFPEGSDLGVMSWLAHFDESIWGTNARDFVPERWIDSSPEHLKQMNHYFMPFGLGSRGCIGKWISLLEINKVVPMLVMCFDFELVDTSGVYKTENRFLVKPTNFQVRVRRRQMEVR